MKRGVMLFRNVKTGDYRVMEMRESKLSGFRIAYGSFILISKMNFRTTGLTTIMDSLNAYSEIEVRGTSELQEMNSAQRSKFHRTNLSLTIWEDDNGVLIIQPDSRVRGGGGIADPSLQTVFEIPISPAHFADKIEKAFEQCE